jgi:four helix bundle protein
LKIQSYQDLIIWQKSFRLAVLVYRFTQKFPKEEIYGLTSQIRRAAVSIPSNIAEGFGRITKKEHLWFIRVALGSVNEVETHLLLSKELGYLEKDSFEVALELIVEVRKMLSAIIKKLI